MSNLEGHLKDFKDIGLTQPFSYSDKEEGETELMKHLNRPTWQILQETCEYHLRLKSERDKIPIEYLPSLKELFGI